jgi:hypothetical protein
MKFTKESPYSFVERYSAKELLILIQKDNATYGDIQNACLMSGISLDCIPEDKISKNELIYCLKILIKNNQDKVVRDSESYNEIMEYLPSEDTY